MGKDEGGVWIRTIGKQINVNEKFSRTYHHNINGLEIGADKAIQLHCREVNVDGMIDTAKFGLKF